MIIGVIFDSTCRKIENYKGTKAYEDLNELEKIVAKVEGYKIYTRKELIDNEASKIVTILKKISSPDNIHDNSNKTLLDEKINACDEIIDELHKENSSGSIIDESLKSIIDNSISAAENYKKGLEAYEKGDFSTSSDYSTKSQDNILEVRNEMERLGFTK